MCTTESERSWLLWSSYLSTLSTDFGNCSNNTHRTRVSQFYIEVTWALFLTTQQEVNQGCFWKFREFRLWHFAFWRIHLKCPIKNRRNLTVKKTLSLVKNKSWCKSFTQTQALLFKEPDYLVNNAVTAICSCQVVDGSLEVHVVLSLAKIITDTNKPFAALSLSGLVMRPFGAALCCN